MKRFIVLFVVVVVIIFTVTSIKHPILFKWVAGSARNLGKPIKAAVYINGSIKTDINVYRIDSYWNGEESEVYLVHAPKAQHGRLKYFTIDKNHRICGVPASANVKDYEVVAGSLFQSETGAKATPFTDDVKGLDFDPDLKFAEQTIKVNIPSGVNAFGVDSVRIELP